MYFKKPCGVFSLSRDPTHNLAEPTFIQHCLSVSPVMEKWSPLFPQAKCLITERSAEMERKLLNVDERQKESLWTEKSKLYVWLKETWPVQTRCFLLYGCSNVWCLEQFVLSVSPLSDATETNPGHRYRNSPSRQPKTFGCHNISENVFTLARREEWMKKK